MLLCIWVGYFTPKCINSIVKQLAEKHDWFLLVTVALETTYMSWFVNYYSFKKRDREESGFFGLVFFVVFLFVCLFLVWRIICVFAFSKWQRFLDELLMPWGTVVCKMLFRVYLTYYLSVIHGSCKPLIIQPTMAGSLGQAAEFCWTCTSSNLCRKEVLGRKGLHGFVE